MTKAGVRTKVVLLGVLMSGVSAIVGAVSYYSLFTTVKKFDWAISQPVPKIQLVDQMFLSYRRVRISLRSLGLSGISATEAEAAIQGVLDAEEEYAVANRGYLALPPVPGQKELYDHLQKTWLEFQDVGVRAIALYRTTGPIDYQKMEKIFLTECPAKAAVYAQAIEALISFHKKEER